MIDRDIKVITKLLRHCDRISASISRTGTYGVFIEDDDAFDAVVLRIGQIGELSRRELSNEIKAELNFIPWKDVCAMRNRLVHGYDMIDMPMLWETAVEDIPVLADALREKLKEYQSSLENQQKYKIDFKPLKLD